MKSKWMAFLISTLICAVLGVIVSLLDVCSECMMAKIIATLIVALWIGLYWLLEPKTGS